MRYDLTIKSLVLAAVILFGFGAVQNASAQDSGKEYSDLDQFILKGFEAVRAGKWSEASVFFEEARKEYGQEKQPSEVLFTMFELPDEDPSDPPKSDEARQILGYRHSMATAQALLQFLAFTNQLAGNDDEANKYMGGVFGLQGPLWGLSWRIFIPQIYKVFNVFVDKTKTKSYGRYLYLAGTLLNEAGDESALSVLREAQTNAPQDAAISADLAGIYLSQKKPEEAKKQAELSLSVDPDQTSVLINLALAEWVLGNFDAAAKTAEKTIKLDGDLPGPHATLAFVYIERGNATAALKEAETGTVLSRRHPFYLTLQAAALEANGKKKEAEKLFKDAWEEDLPDTARLERWFFRGKTLEHINKIIARLK